MTVSPQADYTLDVRGLYCPSPVLRAKEEMDRLQPGQLIRIIASDPATQEDIPRWAKRAGHEVVSLIRDDQDITFVIRKGN